VYAELRAIYPRQCPAGMVIVSVAVKEVPKARGGDIELCPVPPLGLPAKASVSVMNQTCCPPLLALTCRAGAMTPNNVASRVTSNSILNNLFFIFLLSGYRLFYYAFKAVKKLVEIFTRCCISHYYQIR
jgi:hypothetical protein